MFTAYYRSVVNCDAAASELSICLTWISFHSYVYTGSHGMMSIALLSKASGSRLEIKCGRTRRVTVA